MFIIIFLNGAKSAGFLMVSRVSNSWVDTRHEVMLFFIINK